MSCARCIARGRPAHYGSEPKCAFPGGVFDKDNWNCATANALRNLIDRVTEGEVSIDVPAWTERENDESIGVIAISEDIGIGYVVMTWYKNRGRTGNAVVMCDADDPEPLTLEMAEGLLCVLAPAEEEG